MEAADTGIPAAAASDGTQAADALEVFFEHGRIVIEVLAVSASALTGCALFANRQPSG